jgi:cell wall assembly regulator SMI1
MFSKASQNLTKADIYSLEKSIGYALPIDFVNQYLSSNGGVSDKNYFYFEKHDEYLEVSLFIPIAYPSDKLGNLTIEKSYGHLTRAGIPKKYLPFATDWGGNYFSIDLETNDVVLLLMDLGEFTERSVQHLTMGFSHFLDELKEEGE